MEQEVSVLISGHIQEGQFILAPLWILDQTESEL